jgi:hypothetical protein
MTLADQAAMKGQDGQVTDDRVRRTFTAVYKARILATPSARCAKAIRCEYDAWARHRNDRRPEGPLMWGREALGFRTMHRGSNCRMSYKRLDA